MLAPNSTAAVIVWENTWAAPFVAAVPRFGGRGRRQRPARGRRCPRSHRRPVIHHLRREQRCVVVAWAVPASLEPWPARPSSQAPPPPSPGACPTTRTRSTRTRPSRRLLSEQAAAQQQWEQQQQWAAQQQAAAAPPAASGVTEDSIAKLKELAALKDQGILTDAEFEVQKAQILNA